MATKFENYVDGDVIVAEVVMLRGASQKAIMLVEGACDEKVFSEMIDDENCEIIICHGQKNVLDAHDVIEAQQIKGVICIIDSDFSKILGCEVSSDNIIRTDDHDVEIMMFKSRAFNRVTRELASEEKLKRLKGEGKDPRELIRKAAWYVGALRLCSIQLGLNLKFEELNFSFIDRKTLEINVESMIKKVFNKTRKAVDEKKDIINFITEWHDKKHDHWHMCCGHDVCEIFGKALQSVIGNQTAAKTSQENIESILRLGYSYEYFRRTSMYRKIKSWESKNASFICLRRVEAS